MADKADIGKPHDAASWGRFAVAVLVGVLVALAIMWRDLPRERP